MARRSLAPALALAFSASVFGALPPAHAAPHSSSADAAERKRALELFEEGARAYREGRFQDAVDKLLEARRLKAEPVLLYNLARAYEALGKPQEAADAYESYLREEPSTPDRKALEGRIVTLRQQAADLAAARKPPVGDREARPDAPPPVVAPSSEKREPEKPADEGPAPFLPWIVLGVGAAAIGTGFVLGAIANGKHDDAVAEPAQEAAVGLQEDARGLASAATITLVAGAVIALIGGGWIVLRATGSPASSSSAKVSRHGLGWSF